MRLRDLNWMDVERYLANDDRIIVVTGATEQHAYLSLTTDTLIPEYLADAIARREGILVAPPLSYGISELFAEYPGTVSISRATYDALLSDVIYSLAVQGFHNILVLNGNPNHRLPADVVELNESDEVNVWWWDWWQSATAKAFAQQRGLVIDHANWSENFPFCRVVDGPRGKKPFVNAADLENGHSPREVIEDGSLGGRYKLNDREMQVLFDALVGEASDLLRGVVKVAR